MIDSSQYSIGSSHTLGPNLVDMQQLVSIVSPEAQTAHWLITTLYSDFCHAMKHTPIQGPLKKYPLTTGQQIIKNRMDQEFK